MSDKYFPIRTDTSCQLKWAFSKVLLNHGLTSSCHRVKNHKFDIDTFNFHNTPEKIDQRKTMLDGLWPQDGCDQYCGKIERTGQGQSDRQFSLHVPNLTPVELDSDPFATNITPTILEVYVDNTCNLSCVYCIPELSSRIHNELKKFGPFSKNGLVLETNHNQISNYDEIQEKFWQWLKINGSNLKRLQLLGGEPFYQTQFDMFLEFFENNPCPNLEFNIVTNLMISNDKLNGYIDQIKKLIATKKIKRLDVTASIDCWGPQQEFVRYGIDLKQWQENFEYLLDQPWIILNINNTISVLTIKTLPELLVLLSQWNKKRSVGHHFTQLVDPSYMALEILGSEEFREDFLEISKLMESESWQASQAKMYMTGIIATIRNSVYNKDETIKLLTFLDEMDRRRKTNWRELFPWLIKYEALCGIQK